MIFDRWPKTGKERLLKDCKNFNSSVHEIVSFDASKLYTSVNTTRVISEILKIIYKNPSNFFKEKDINGRLLPFPKRANLRNFMHSVLLNFNTFESQIGSSGLAMGSPEQF